MTTVLQSRFTRITQPYHESMTQRSKPAPERSRQKDGYQNSKARFNFVGLHAMAALAQERLIALEKIDAPITEQIQQATLFAGVTLPKSTSSHDPVESPGAIRKLHRSNFHGREEYCLRWLLRKLQDGKNRRYTEVWQLLNVLIERVPLRNLARVLNEKKFVLILRETLEEAALPICMVGDSSDKVVGSPLKVKPATLETRKRKRDGSPSDNCAAIYTPVDDNEKINTNWRRAVYEVINRIVQLSNLGSLSQDTSTSEYMKSVIQTSSDEAARILGAWLNLCAARKGILATRPGYTLLPPFFEIWNSRTVGTEDAKAFSKYCLVPSLTIMSEASPISERKSHLEKLIASNIVIPAKLMYGPSKDTKFLVGLVGDAVSKNPDYASIIFDITIRSIQPHQFRIRGTDDNKWLQAVFSALEESLNRNTSKASIATLKKMLQCCINHKIALELPFMQSIASHYGFPSGETNWDLLTSIIELDPNTFLISSKPEDLLQLLLKRITKSSTETTWPTIVDQVVDSVLNPLMCEFAKARQLTLFIRHWYEQLVEVDRIQRSSQVKIEHFTAWEDEMLRKRLREILEPSLTTIQIIDIVEWLITKLEEGVGPACVILDAVAEAIAEEDTRAALHSTLVDKVINVMEYDRPDDRYKFRILHLNTVVLSWSSRQSFDNSSMTDGSSPLFLRLLSSDISFAHRDQSLTALEAFRFLCAQWSIGEPSIWEDMPVSFRAGAGVETLSNHIASVASLVRNTVKKTAESRTLGEQEWGGRATMISRSLEWLTCAYASCILVEYPQVLELCREGQMLTDFIWIASTTTVPTSLYLQDPWLPITQAGLPSLWMEMLRHDGYVENSKTLSQNIIKRMIECIKHEENPTEKSSAYNGFVVMCFHHLPLEILWRSDREAIFKTWLPDSSHSSAGEVPSLSFKMDPSNPAVLSLRAKMQRRPNLYDGIKFWDLVDLAESIAAIGEEREVQLEIFAEIPELILEHVFATIDQPKSRDYIQGTKEILEKWLQVNRQSKKGPSYAMIRLVQIVLVVWKAKGNSSDEFLMALEESTEKFSAAFKDLLLSNLNRRLRKPKKLTQEPEESRMSLYCTMDALDAIGVAESELAEQGFDVISALDSLKKLDLQLGKRFELLLTENCARVFGKPPKKLLEGDISTADGRDTIRRKVMAITERMTEPGRLHLVADLIAEIGDEQALDRLLALKYVITSCEDSRTVPPEEEDHLIPRLSSSYSNLTTQLLKSGSIRRCWLICEIMEIILREKPRSITQYNIDTTLANVTILCSHKSPSLDPSGAGSIYRHAVKLVNAILTSHRLKIKGHFHVVVQTLQPLLYCLFTPSSAGNSNSRSGSSFPPWLKPGFKTLDATHAAAFTRLLTLICDPSVSAVSRPSSSALNSATKKAKTLAGQHMPFVLSTYIRAQLDMSLSMKQSVREALVPGWYAIFDTMTVESRKALGESLDASGRAILSGLIKDWVRFGKWDGN